MKRQPTMPRTSFAEWNTQLRAGRRPAAIKHTRGNMGAPIHAWMGTLRARKGYSRKLWRCPICKQCQYTAWHNPEITGPKRHCPKCSLHPCHVSPRKCGHMECDMCFIGHGLIVVTDGRCQACKEWMADHPGWEKPIDGERYEEELRDRFVREVDPDGVLPIEERRRRAEAARKAVYVRMGLASGEARRRKKQP